MIKVIFCDVSGTLLTTKGTISYETIKSIRLLSQIGINFVLCSGGARGKLLDLTSNLGIQDYIISSNGADIYDTKNKKIILSNKIEFNDIIKIYTIVRNYNLFFSINYDSIIYTNKKRLNVNYELVNDTWNKQFFINHEPEQCTLSGIPRKKEIIEKIISKINLMPNVKIASNNINLKEELLEKLNLYCDIVNNNTDKQIAAMYLLKKMNITSEEAMVICDGINDLNLFNLVKYRIAMGNAIEEIKNQATFITDSNNEEGVNKVLKK